MKPGSANPEFELLLTIARSADRPDACRQLILEHQINWDYLFHLAEFHRMLPLLYLALKEIERAAVPEDFQHRLKAYNFDNTRMNIALLAEKLSLIQTFNQNAIQAVPFKGVILSKILYDDYSTRQAGDIDILVKPTDVLSAIDLLEQRGYSLAKSLTKDQQLALVQISSEKHHLLVNAHNQLAVEIHWGFTHTDIMSKKDLRLLWSWVEMKTVNALPVHFFRPEPLLLILCLHGYKHSWDHLFWLWEFSTIVQQVALDWDWIVRHVESFGGINVLIVSLLLAKRTLGTAIPPAINEELLTNPEAIYLLTRINLKPERFELQAKKDHPLLDVRTRFKVKRSLFRRVRQVLRFFFTPNYFDIRVVSLPPAFYFVYFIIRPLRLLSSNINRLFRGSNADNATSE
ncbi:MAG: nucleotidyltransferase family protein [Anaerolineales bacterium]|nr:nucleotidyltransferase family protein [Anaerolineales bacterium]